MVVPGLSVLLLLTQTPSQAAANDAEANDKAAAVKAAFKKILFNL